MPVAGLVVTLTELDLLRAQCLDALSADPRVTLGEMQRGGRLPLVLATASVREERDLLDDLARTPGVLLVDLAYHDFSDVEGFRSDDLPSRRRSQE